MRCLVHLLASYHLKQAISLLFLYMMLTVTIILLHNKVEVFRNEKDFNLETNVFLSSSWSLWLTPRCTSFSCRFHLLFGYFKENSQKIAAEGFSLRNTEEIWCLWHWCSDVSIYCYKRLDNYSFNTMCLINISWIRFLFLHLLCLWLFRLHIGNRKICANLRVLGVLKKMKKKQRKMQSLRAEK